MLAYRPDTRITLIGCIGNRLTAACFPRFSALLFTPSSGLFAGLRMLRRFSIIGRVPRVAGT